MLVLTRSQIEQIVAQARRDAPNETWGVMGGKDGRALKVYPMQNAAPTPETRYAIDTQDFFRAIHEIEFENDWQVVVIYHSHPKTEARPSETDINEARYPDAIYIIISLREPEQAVVRAFTISEEKQVAEITLEIEDENESPRANSRGAARRAGGSRPRRAVATLSGRRPRRVQVRRARR